MTGEATIREDGADVIVEAQGVGVDGGAEGDEADDALDQDSNYTVF